MLLLFFPFIVTYIVFLVISLKRWSENESNNRIVFVQFLLYIIILVLNSLTVAATGWACGDAISCPTLHQAAKLSLITLSIGSLLLLISIVITFLNIFTLKYLKQYEIKKSPSRRIQRALNFVILLMQLGGLIITIFLFQELLINI